MSQSSGSELDDVDEEVRHQPGAVGGAGVDSDDDDDLVAQQPPDELYDDDADEKARRHSGTGRLL